MSEEEIRELLKYAHRDNQSSVELKESLSKLLAMRSRFYLDHPWSGRIDPIIHNAQLRLQMKLSEESQSIPNLIKRGLVTETLKFMVPFILGIIVALYGFPHFGKNNQPSSNATLPQKATSNSNSSQSTP
jgi:hypothetical protein